MDRFERVFSHWAWALPILLVVAALAVGQFKLYAPSTDEIHSAAVAGLVVESELSPIETVKRLWRVGPDHMPGYFLFLNAWGHLVAGDIVFTRVPSIYAALLSLAIAYRLARDAVAPLAGLFAVIIIASNTHYNFYYDHARMYSFVVFFSGCLMWLYWRLTWSQARKPTRYALALTVAVAAVVSLHLINAFFLLAALSLQHLLFVDKTRRWLIFPIATGVALICLSPLIAAVANNGLGRWEGRILPHTIIDGFSYAAAHFRVMLNNQPVLLLPAVAGLLFPFSQKKSAGRVWLVIWCLGLVVMAVFIEIYQLFGVKHIRYSLSLMLPFALFMAAGWQALYRWRRWTALLVPVWMAAGLVFQQSGEWNQYLTAGRSLSFTEQPIHTISALALREQLRPQIFIYTDVHLPYRLDGLSFGYSKRDYYFSRYGISAKSISADLGSLAFDAVITPSVWISYQTSIAVPDMSPIISEMSARYYQLCHTENLVAATVVLQFRWESLDCSEPLALQQSGETEKITYQFFGAKLSDDGDQLHFVDRWREQNASSLARYKMSWQLLSDDRQNLAQLDLPLVQTNLLRRFAIDISRVPPGTYRLTAILYDAENGMRFSWINDTGWVSEILQLATVEKPA